MDSAIAPRLRCPRTLSRRIEDDYNPPYPAWVGRPDPNVDQVVMGYFGVQFRGAALRAKADAALAGIVAGFEVEDGPRSHDLARYVDAQGYDNLIAIAYWADPAAFERWRDSPAIADWWNAEARLQEGLGYFREILAPRIDAFESLFSAADRMEGVAVGTGVRSEQDIQEHGYWGSMRDRIARSQTDSLEAIGDLTIVEGSPGLGRRVRLGGHGNIAVIRSGQDWTDTTGRERALYLGNMEPVLRNGMDFLVEEGASIGCYTNRYMQHVDADGQPIEKSFGYSYWRSLAHMEQWSESHPTHVAIFGTFMGIVQELNFQLQLRLYHEVSVLAPEQQLYEYINCHPKTGLLNGM